MRIHGRFEHGFGWQPEPSHYMERSCTALAIDGKVWLIDPERVDGIEAELEALGRPTGIISLVGWHDRSVDWYAARYGIPVYGARWLRNQLFRTPLVRVDREVPETPFQLIDTSMRGLWGWWSESALWWPEERTLVVGDALGSAVYFAPEHVKLGVHPISRFSTTRALDALEPQRIYCGHGVSVTEGATEALRRALRDGRGSPLPAWRSAVRRLWQRSRA
ncbi:MAG TPA: hypothetical protein VFN74_00260 [Chloroflexota bacterium]|nr:hypothetical protein [Chloroflexota bacterium]